MRSISTLMSLLIGTMASHLLPSFYLFVHQIVCITYGKVAVGKMRAQVRIIQ